MILPELYQESCTATRFWVLTFDNTYLPQYLQQPFLLSHLFVIAETWDCLAGIRMVFFHSLAQYNKTQPLKLYLTYLRRLYQHFYLCPCLIQWGRKSTVIKMLNFSTDFYLTSWLVYIYLIILLAFAVSRKFQNIWNRT